MKNWTDCQRDDLNNIPLAIEKGWSPDFNYKDKMHHRTTPENVPHDCVSFKKDNKSAWKIYTKTSESYFPQWRVADLIDGYYRNHRTYDTLEDVFENE
ncbi:MAG: hypothetical protein JXA77_11280 [Bacteroidales bacterium]|nr:hypothetical protein [Bacteroidales bacterium]